MSFEDDTNVDYAEIKGHRDNINIQYLDNYKDWLKIIWSLKSDDEQLYECAKQLSSESKTYNKLAINELWNAYDINNSKLLIYNSQLELFIIILKLVIKKAFIKYK